MSKSEVVSDDSILSESEAVFADGNFSEDDQDFSETEAVSADRVFSEDNRGFSETEGLLGYDYAVLPVT